MIIAKNGDHLILQVYSTMIIENIKEEFYDVIISEVKNNNDNPFFCVYFLELPPSPRQVYKVSCLTRILFKKPYSFVDESTRCIILKSFYNLYQCQFKEQVIWIFVWMMMFCFLFSLSSCLSCQYNLVFSLNKYQTNFFS